MGRSLLKRCWQASPQSLQAMFCAGLCRLRAQRRLREAAGGDPVFVCGAFASRCGLAEGARLYAAALERQGCQPRRVDITGAMRLTPAAPLQPGVLSVAQAAALPGPGTVVIHANPPQFQLALCALGKPFLRDKRVVGYWAWELETLPAVWRQALDYVDAVETPSAFAAGAVRRCTARPVTVRPHCLPVPARRKTGYAAGGMVRCLYIFDAGSSWERKNPEAALAAFAGAFGPGEAELTFKVGNADAEPARFAAFRAACARVPGVRIVTETLDAAGMDDLYLEHDIYLSLHRSEGYGLTIGEALNRGLHVVATGWSGNMEFMTGERAHPVPYTLVPLSVKRGACRAPGSRWAEPDVGAAAEIVRRLRLELTAS